MIMFYGTISFIQFNISSSSSICFGTFYEMVYSLVIFIFIFVS